MSNGRITIFTGHYGSGKTEVAVNYSINLKNSGKHVALVDLDIVNPYFRTADVKEMLEDMGIHVIIPPFAGTNVDLPYLPAEIKAIFEHKNRHAVFDAGGDPEGARVLSCFRQELISEGYEMLLVVNTKRPATDNPDKISEMAHFIQKSSGLEVTALINNTNLLGQTSSDIILEGHGIIKETSKKLGIPIAYVSGLYDIMKELDMTSYYDDMISKLYLDRKIRYIWE